MKTAILLSLTWHNLLPIYGLQTHRRNKTLQKFSVDLSPFFAKSHTVQ